MRNAGVTPEVGTGVTPGQWLLLVSVVAALALGAYRAWADGRFRGTHAVRGAVPLPEATPAPVS